MAIRGVPRERDAISAAPSGDWSNYARGAALVVGVDVEDSRGAGDDRPQVVRGIEVEPFDEAETVAQGPRDQAGPRRRTHEREGREVEPDRARRRPLAEHHVELKVLHRRIEHLFDHLGKAVDLVDEQDVAIAEVGQQRRQIARSLDRWARGHMQGHLQLGGDDARKGRLSETRWTGEQQVIRRLLPGARRFEHDAQVVLELGLADELVERGGPQADLDGHVLVVRFAVGDLRPRSRALRLHIAAIPLLTAPAVVDVGHADLTRSPRAAEAPPAARRRRRRPRARRPLARSPQR